MGEATGGWPRYLPIPSYPPIPLPERQPMGSRERRRRFHGHTEGVGDLQRVAIDQHDNRADFEGIHPERKRDAVPRVLPGPLPGAEDGIEISMGLLPE